MDKGPLADQVHKVEQSGEVPRRKVVGVGVPHTNKPVPVVDKVTSCAYVVAPPQFDKEEIVPVSDPPKTTLVPTRSAVSDGLVTVLAVANDVLAVREIAVPPPVVNVYVQVQPELPIWKRLALEVPHTKIDDDASVAQVSTVLQGATLPHVGGVVTCVAVENRTCVPLASVPTAAETRFVVALIDQTAAVVVVVLASMDIDSGT